MTEVTIFVDPQDTYKLTNVALVVKCHVTIERLGDGFDDLIIVKLSGDSALEEAERIREILSAEDEEEEDETTGGDVPLF